MKRTTLLVFPLTSLACVVAQAQTMPEVVQDVRVLIVDDPIPPIKAAQTEARALRADLSAWTACNERCIDIKSEDQRPAYRRQNNEPFYMSVPKRKRGRK